VGGHSGHAIVLVEMGPLIDPSRPKAHDREAVLFADLKGSMELLADRDPEEARKILNPVLERMMEAVHRYEGT
jgi:class 3 adenylate cyclase